jgi:hypothetical protein
MKSLFKVRTLDFVFVGFDSYDAALKVAHKIRQAYKQKYRTKISDNVEANPDRPGYLLIAG